MNEENTLADSMQQSFVAKELATDERGRLSRFVEFTALKYAAVVEWVGGTIAGNALHETTGMSRWGVAAGVAISVALMEYPQSRFAARLRNDPDSIEDNTGSVPEEIGALWSSVYQGAGATVTYNESVGIATTKKRSRVQSALYGVAVGLWSSPIPGFKHLSEGGTGLVKDAVENPVQYSLSGLAGSIGIFSAFELIKHRKNRKQNTQVK